MLTLSMILQRLETKEEFELVEGIYRAHYERMVQIAFNILKHPQDSEDAAMTAISNIAKNVHKFIGLCQNSVTALVIVYTRNAARNLFNDRKKKSCISLSQQDDEHDYIFDIPDVTQDIQKLIINQETSKMLKDAIKKLPMAQHDVVWLIWYEQYSYSEASIALGITQDAVGSRLSRAKENLRKLLGEDAYERI